MDFSPWTLFRPPGDVKSATSPTIHFNSNSWQGCTSCVVQQGAHITFQHILTSFCLHRLSDQLICNEDGGWRYFPSDFLPKFIIKFCLRVWVWILTVLYVIQAILYFIGAISASVNIDEVKNLSLQFGNSWLHHIGVISQVHTDVKDRAIGVLVFFWIITVLDMIASISIIGALV